MQITLAQVGNALYPLTEGQPLPISVGETIKVFYAFSYRMPEKTTVRIWASLYNYTLGVLNRQEKAQTKQTITLGEALEWKPYEGEIDIEVGEISSGTYGLICELPDFDAEHHIDDCIEVAAAPGILDILPLLMAVMMMGMIMPMMEEG